MSALQGGHAGQGELWLVLSDPSLQQDQPERPRRRTLALCVSASCLLTSSVVRALESPAGCRMSFRDVVREHGRSLLCPAALRDAPITQLYCALNYSAAGRLDSLIGNFIEIVTRNQQMGLRGPEDKAGYAGPLSSDSAPRVNNRPEFDLLHLWICA